MSIIPQDVTGLDMAFGGDVKKLLPPYDEIPKEFKMWMTGGNKWIDTVNNWFFSGLKNAKWTPKEGIDTKQAIAHVKACMASFEPKHEHKISGCAYLLSQFFEDVQYDQ